MASHLEAEDIAHIEIETYEHVREEGDRKELNSPMDATFSLYYNVAAYVLGGGSMCVDDFTSVAIRRQEHKDFMEKITIRSREDFSAMYPEKLPFRAIVEAKDGRRFEYTTLYQLGSVENPLSDEDLLKKWRSLFYEKYDTEHTEKILDVLLNLENSPSVKSVWKLME
ncbi:MAG: MmgE/PrpD family protein [Desulfitobacterium sp.]|nr:MmgE/PrpD family protein [Desulfitobacterium sp.]